MISPALQAPYGLMLGEEDDLYATDTKSHCIRRICGLRKAAWVTTVVPAANVATNSSSAAAFCFPTSITRDPASGSMYICDYGNCCIKEIPASGDCVLTLKPTTRRNNTAANDRVSGVFAR